MMDDNASVSTLGLEGYAHDSSSPADDPNRKEVSPDDNEAKPQEEASTEPPADDLDSFIQSLPIAVAEPEILPMTTSALSLSDAAESSIPVATEVSVLENGTRGNGRPIQMSVKVHKHTIDTKLGIRFSNNTHGNLQVGYIDPNGMLGDTMLRVGDSIIGMDGNHGCSSWSPNKAARYLKDCIGYVTIVARNPLGDPDISQLAVYKAVPTLKLGISLENEAKTGLLRILKLNNLLGDPESLLRVGDYVERINGVDCSTMDKSLALSLIRECPSLVTIDVKKTLEEQDEHAEDDDDDHHNILLHSSLRDVVASSTCSSSSRRSFNLPQVTATEATAPTRMQHYPDPAFWSISVHKPTKDTKLGLALWNNDKGDLVISRSPRGGLLANFPLQSGLHLMSINHTACGTWTASRALNLLRDVHGVVHLVFYNRKGNLSYVMAGAQKSTTRVGVSFSRSSGRPLKLCEIRPDGLFGQSVLNVGDTIIAINQQSCEHERPKEAVDIVKQASEVVTILARNHVANGVVVSRRTQIIRNRTATKQAL